MNKITIAIDGYSSTGKSTVAKQLANALGYVYVDSGAMYRAMTLFAMTHNLIDEDKFDFEKLITQLDAIKINFKFNKKLGFAEVYLNDENVEKKIRTLEVSRYVSKVATIPEVRKQMVKQQKALGKEKGVVMDGRDIGTVVFPDAELKLFMTASPEKRAIRRYDELIQRGDKVTFDEVLENVKSRDHIDSTRKDSPLIKAQDAIVIDNTHLSLKEQFDKVLELSKKAIKNTQ
jgi:cytidylate kinase